MPITRINNNQISDASAGNIYLGVNAAAKLQDYSLTSGKIANDLTYNSSLTITGNLTVQGNTTAIDTVNLTVEDPLILLAKEQTGSPALDIGFIGKRGTEDNIAFVWDESADQFVAVFTTSEVTNTTISINSYASMQVANLTAANATISGEVNLGNITVGNVVGDLLITGNATASNFLTTGVVSAQGNVTGGNLITSGLITATGNISGDNISATANITGANIIATQGFFGNVDISGDITVNSLTSNTFVSATGNVIGANISTTGLITATGNIDGGNINTGGDASVTGNVNSGNVNTTAVVATTVSATGNIDGGNIQTSGLISATGNLDSANVNTGIVSATGNIVGPNVVTSTVTTASGDLTLNSAGGALQWAGTGNIVMNSQWINNLADPVVAQDAATKQYVDDAVSSGIHIHTPVDVETPTALPAATYNQGGTTATVTDTIAGNTVVFSTAVNPQVNDQLWFTNSFNGVVADIAYFVVSAPNTSAAVLSTQYNGSPVSNITGGSSLTESVRINSGFGANLTANASGALTVDGFSVSAGNRVLVYNQNNAVENGIYVVTDAGNVSAPWILTRSDDANSYIPDSPVGLDEGSYVYVKFGDTGAGESYVMTTPQGPFNIGAANVVFTQFTASQVYSANTSAGLVLNGTVFSAKVDNDTTAFDGGGNIIVKAGANLVTPNIGDATGNSLTLTGNGNISASNIDLSGLISATGNVTGGNINTGGDASVTGNVNSGNVNTAIVSATGNVIGANVSTAGLITATGNIDGGNLNTGGDVSATGNVNSGNVNTAIVSATGNITGGNIDTAGLISATGNITGGNINTGGDASVTGNVNSGNVNTAIVSATGNVVANNVIGTTSGQFGNIVISGDDITDVGGGIVTINVAGADVDFAVNGDTNANIFYVDAGTGTASFGNATQTTNAIVAFNAVNSILIPVGNTLQRPAVGVTGMIRFNTTSDSLEYYDNDSWTSAGTTFTVVTADSFVGDGSTTTFTLSEDSTTAATIVSINGVVQIPTTAYAVTGNSLQFTEAPAVSDLIDARLLVTTQTVIGITNSSGNAVFEGSASESAFISTGNILPAANVTYNLGSDSFRWNDIYLAGNSVFLGNVILKENAGNLRVRNFDDTADAVVEATFLSTSTTSGNLQIGDNHIEATNLNGNIEFRPNGAGVILANSVIQLNAGIINGAGNGTGNIGNATGYFNTIFAKATSAQYADLAEMYAADQIIEPGTVVCFGGAEEIMICDEDSCKQVAGVVSTNPSYIMNAGLEGDYVTAVALTGRVPTKVTGTVRKGDMMVAAGDGRARAESDPAVGTVIGKALANFDGNDGVIEIVVGRL